VHLVGDGLVDELAGDLLDAVDGAQTLVALGGGRVVDTAKALAAACDIAGGRRFRRPKAKDPLVAAIPTTLSAAEMTRLHRQARGGPADRHVRPALVLNDPALSASQPVEELAASTANALGHALEAQASALASPVPTLAGREAAALLREAWASDPAEPDRDALALGALLSGYAIDGAWYGLHHVLAQTLVRVAGVGHGQRRPAAPHPRRADPAHARAGRRRRLVRPGPPARRARRGADPHGAGRRRRHDRGVRRRRRAAPGAGQHPAGRRPPSCWRSTRPPGSRSPSPVDLAPVPDAQHEHEEPVLLDLVDDAVVTGPNPPLAAPADQSSRRGRSRFSGQQLDRGLEASADRRVELA
jgi:hypothetical protein